MSRADKLQKIEKRITPLEWYVSQYVSTVDPVFILDGISGRRIAKCLDVDLARLFAYALSDIRYMLKYIRELELETTTTWVSCDGCDIGFRPRELYLGRCAKCWADLARNPSGILKGLDDAF